MFELHMHELIAEAAEAFLRGDPVDLPNGDIVRKTLLGDILPMEKGPKVSLLEREAITTLLHVASIPNTTLEAYEKDLVYLMIMMDNTKRVPYFNFLKRSVMVLSTMGELRWGRGMMRKRLPIVIEAFKKDNMK